MCMSYGKAFGSLLGCFQGVRSFEKGKRERGGEKREGLEGWT